MTPKETTTASNATAKFRMVALDLDGTLLQSNHQLSDATREYLNELDRQGFIICIATGRAASTVYEHVIKLNFPHPLPVVCSNGARGLKCSVVVQEDGTPSSSVSVEELFASNVPETVATKTIQLAQKLGYVSQYYVGENIYADPREAHHFELTDMYKQLTGSNTIYVKDGFKEAVKLGLPSKQLVLCPNHQQDEMIAAFEKEFGNDEATIVRGSMGWFLEVLHPNVNKGNGLRNMCQHLKNVDLDQVVAFGDGDNDLEFLKMAKRGICMQNGRAVVKEIADEVIEYTNDQDGVVKTLQRMQEEGALIFSSPVASGN